MYLAFALVGVVLVALGLWEVALPPQYPYPDSSFGVRTMVYNAQTVLIPAGAAVFGISLVILFLLELEGNRQRKAH